MAPKRLPQTRRGRFWGRSDLINLRLDLNPLRPKAAISLVFRCWRGAQWELWWQDTDLPALSHSKPLAPPSCHGRHRGEVGGGGGGASREHKSGNARSTPRVTDYKTQRCCRAEKALPGATKTSCQQFTCVRGPPRQRKRFSVVGGEPCSVDGWPSVHICLRTHTQPHCSCVRELKSDSADRLEGSREEHADSHVKRHEEKKTSFHRIYFGLRFCKWLTVRLRKEHLL